LLSVVLIDDHAELTHSDDQDPGRGGHGLDAKAIADAFADRGIVCGVLKPNVAKENVVGRAQSAAKRADVVVLDWNLTGEDESGDLACEILLALLKVDDAQHMLRFFVIYTATPGLRDIAARCVELLRSLGDEFEVDDEDEFTLRRGPVTLSIFAKDTVPAFIDGELEIRRASFGELPEKILGDYRLRAPGMVESAALRAVGQVRSRTHLLLARFPSDIDPGYLWHRARLSEQDDAATQIVEMIGAEITDVIASDIVRGEVSTDAAIAWVQSREALLIRPGQFEKEKVAPFEEIKKIVEAGAEAAKETDNISFKAFREDGAKFGLPIFAESSVEMDDSHERLAMLMTLRDPEPNPWLRSGVIIQIEKELLLCIQPLCDSVRLSNKKGERVVFPFLRLVEPSDEAKGRFNIVIPLDKEARVRRLILDKPSLIATLEFPKVGDTVNAVSDDGRVVFRRNDAPAAVYRATLRPMKAVSVLTLLASMLSRTGLSDPEWLRGSAK
jgi:hypothetical protein